MDRNQTIGLVLISMLVIVYIQFFGDRPEIPVQEATPTEIVQTPTTEQAIINPAYDSLAIAQRKAQLGDLAVAAEGTSEIVTLENDLVKFTFNTKGGMVSSVLLKNFLTYDKQPLYLLDEESSQMNMVLGLGGKNVSLSDLYFEPSAKNVLVENDTVKLQFVLSTESGSLTQVYSLAPNSYELGYQLITNNLNTSNPKVSFSWNDKIKKAEREISDSRNRSSVNFYTVSGDFDNIGENTIDKKEAVPSEDLQWIAIKQKFFTAAIITKGAVSGAQMSSFASEKDTSYVKEANIKAELSLSELEAGKFSFYYGPNDYKILKKVTAGFDRNIVLGWALFSWINKWVIIQVFQFLENYISNYGIIIILLVIFIKLILSPLSYTSYLSMAKMKVLKPELDALKEKYGDDAQKIQTETMQLYSKAGVNPLSGCIPLLLQMPILFAMFYFFPNSIELRQEAFLWASDLSTYDSVLSLPFTIPFYGSHVSLFTILMTASTILYTWSNNQVSTVTGPMKSLGYVMPVMFMFVLNSFPASLSFYYFVSNMVTFGQQFIIRQFVDEGKIKKIMEENKKKNVNKKKSSFQQRLEDAMKASQEAKKK